MKYFVLCLVGFALIFQAITCAPASTNPLAPSSRPNLSGRGADHGCSNRYCWTRCTGLGLGLIPSEWCYTTTGALMDFRYVSCNDDDQCKMNWNCAGFCSV